MTACLRHTLPPKMLLPFALLAWAGAAPAASQDERLGNLGPSATVAAPDAAGGAMAHAPLWSGEIGALRQPIDLSVDHGVWTTRTGLGQWRGPGKAGATLVVLADSGSLPSADTFVGVAAGVSLAAMGAITLPASHRDAATGPAAQPTAADEALGVASMVPEPATIALVLAGLGSLGFMARRAGG